MIFFLPRISEFFSPKILNIQQTENLKFSSSTELEDMLHSISRDSDLNGVSRLDNMLEVYHSGPEPVICTLHTHTHTSVSQCCLLQGDTIIAIDATGKERSHAYLHAYVHVHLN